MKATEDGYTPHHMVLTKYSHMRAGHDPSIDRVISQAELELCLVRTDAPMSEIRPGMCLVIRPSGGDEQIALLLSPPAIAWIATVASETLRSSHPSMADVIEGFDWQDMFMPIESTLMVHAGPPQEGDCQGGNTRGNSDDDDEGDE